MSNTFNRTGLTRNAFLKGPVPDFPPRFFGQHYIVTEGEHRGMVYVARGTKSYKDWVVRHSLFETTDVEATKDTMKRNQTLKFDTKTKKWKPGGGVL